MDDEFRRLFTSVQQINEGNTKIKQDYLDFVQQSQQLQEVIETLNTALENLQRKYDDLSLENNARQSNFEQLSANVLGLEERINVRVEEFSSSSRTRVEDSEETHTAARLRIQELQLQLQHEKQKTGNLLLKTNFWQKIKWAFGKTPEHLKPLINPTPENEAPDQI